MSIIIEELLSYLFFAGIIFIIAFALIAVLIFALSAIIGKTKCFFSVGQLFSFMAHRTRLFLLGILVTS